MSHLYGKFVWFELSAPDVERAKGFYGELFGWTTADMPMGDQVYTLFKSGDRMVGGAHTGDGSPGWVSYLSVEDVDASLKRAVAAGATAKGEAHDVPTVGRMAEVVDPTGGRFYFFHGAEADVADREATPGDFHWNELWSPDPERAANFYKDIAGYQIQEKDMGDMGAYRVLVHGEVPRAGVMKQPSTRSPVAWVPYVTVSHADDIAARAQRLGGQVINPPSDVPTVGRLAVLADPAGGLIAIITPESLRKK